MSSDTTTAAEELTAVQDQITNAGLNVFYAEYGIILPTPIPGVTKVPGSGGKTDEEKAAAEATKTAAGNKTDASQMRAPD